MKQYVGIDIGTTNTKILTISAMGHVTHTFITKTPVVCIKGITYFDLPKLETYLMNHIEHLKYIHEIAGISVTSIGESVVPVKNRKALSLPLVWHESCTQDIYIDNKEKVQNIAPYSKVGITHDNSTLSLYKILWMLKNLDIQHVEYWLPVSSYFLYILGAPPAWAESQACRSLMFDIYTRSWITELWDFFPLSGELGAIAYTGNIIGKTKDNIPLIMSGHDHITGLFGAYLLANEAPLIYHSMGSASITAAIVNSTLEKNYFSKPFLNHQKGTIGASFLDNHYVLQNSFKYFGLIIEQIFRMKNLEATEAHILKINKKIEEAPTPSAEKIMIFMAEKDPIFSRVCNGISYLNLTVTPTLEHMLQCCYLYLAITSSYTVKELSMFLSKDFLCYAGGAIVHNQLFMKYLSTAIEKVIIVPKTSEITSLGAALAVMKGLNNQDAINMYRSKIENKIFEPDSTLQSFMKTVYYKYYEWEQKMDKIME